MRRAKPKAKQQIEVRGPIPVKREQRLFGVGTRWMATVRSSRLVTLNVRFRG